MVSGKNSKKYFYGSELIFAASQWLFFVTTYYISGPLEAGRVAFSLSIVTPIFLLSNMQLRSLCSIDSKNKISVYFKVRIKSTILAMIAAIGIAHFIQNSENKNTYYILIIIAILKSIESVHDIIGAHHIKTNGESRILIGSIIKILGYGCIYPLALKYTSIEESLIILVIYLTILLMAIEYRTLEIIKAEWESSKNSSHIIFNALPLGAASLFDSLGINLLKVYIGSTAGYSELGKFNIIFQIIQMPQVLLSAINRYNMHRISLSKNLAEKKLKILLTYLQSILAGIFLILIMSSDHLLRIIIKDKDANIDQISNYTNILAWAGLFWYASGSTAVKCILNNNNNAILISTFISSFLMLFICKIFNGISSEIIIASLALLIGYLVRISIMELLYKSKISRQFK